MRNKRRKRMGQMLELGIDVNPELIGSRYAMSRKKDRVRMKVANSRNRVQGLFVNKQKEEVLENMNRVNESATYCED